MGLARIKDREATKKWVKRQLSKARRRARPGGEGMAAQAITPPVEIDSYEAAFIHEKQIPDV